MPPNFLFIVADDLNAWIGALGRNPDVRTPHLDALAGRGTLFLNAFCSAPYCNASRMGVFTGCLPLTTGIYENEPLWETPNRKTTFVEILRSAGYCTFGAGKVFHGAFDYASAGRNAASEARWIEMQNRSFLWNEFRHNQHDPLPPNRPLNKLFDFSDFDAVPSMYHHFDWGPIPEDRTDQLPDAMVLSAVTEFLQRPPDEPFFCAAGFYKPHLPWHVPKRFFDLYDPQRISLPLVKNDDLEDVPDIARNWALSSPDHELVTSRNQWPEAVRGYLAAISYVDHLIGTLIAVLDRTGLAETTAVIIWGDNGFHLGEKLHWRKFVLWEEATRVPLIIIPPSPRRVANRVTSPVSLVDIFPTVLSLAGYRHDAQSIDGFDLTEMLEAPYAERPAPVAMTWTKGNHSVRDNRWRFTRYRDGSEELYDHVADPYEWTNLAGDGAFKEVRCRLALALPRS
jgi:arylsulfatase A-like enzyme